MAERLGAEIVSVDSMLVYRGMDIGTAKPTAAQRERVRHHLLDVAEPSERFTVARYQELARGALAHVDRPLLVGGSGLYFRAIVDGLAFPPEDAEVRRSLGDRARRARGRPPARPAPMDRSGGRREDRRAERAPDGAGARGRGADGGAVQLLRRAVDALRPRGRARGRGPDATGPRWRRGARRACTRCWTRAGSRRWPVWWRAASGDGSPRRRRSATRSSRGTSTVGSRSTRRSNGPCAGRRSWGAAR